MWKAPQVQAAVDGWHGAVGVQGADDLRDDVAGAADPQAPADTYAEALHLGDVVEGGAGDEDAADGLELGDWSEHAGAADLSGHGAQAGDGLLGGELPGDGPAGARAVEPRPARGAMGSSLTTQPSMS